MKNRYMKVKKNQWVQPIMRGYLMKCCNCGYTHELEFRIAQGKSQPELRVQMRAVKAFLPEKKKK